MTEKILTLIFVVQVITSCSIKKNSLEKSLYEYIDYSNSAQFEKCVDMMPSKFLDMYSKETLVKQLEFVHNEFGHSRLDSFKVKNVSDLVSFNDTLYALVIYDCIYKLTLNKEKADKAELLRNGFEKQYPNQSVILDTIKLQYRIHIESRMFCLSYDHGKNWRFIEKHKDIKRNQLVINKNILEQLD
ncbi:MAG: hypothetical protein MI866_02755 [Bacteroidales bacterium]|nr:hypothetical protein [Bacteroidales bacterium]